MTRDHCVVARVTFAMPSVESMVESTPHHEAAMKVEPQPAGAKDMDHLRDFPRVPAHIFQIDELSVPGSDQYGAVATPMQLPKRSVASLSTLTPAARLATVGVEKQLVC